MLHYYLILEDTEFIEDKDYSRLNHCLQWLMHYYIILAW